MYELELIRDVLGLVRREDQDQDRLRGLHPREVLDPADWQYEVHPTPYLGTIPIPTITDHLTFLQTLSTW